MKKFLVTMLVVMLVAIGLNPSSSYADSSSSAKDSSNQSLFPPYSSIVNSDTLLSGLTLEEYNEAITNAVPLESVIVKSESDKTQSIEKISPMTLTSWAFDHLAKHDGYWTDKFYVDYAITMPINVVQWGDDSSWSQPDVGYTLVNKDYLGKVHLVSGRYTGTNTKFEIKAPGPGTYQILVNNLNDYTISGNGFIGY
ncbi:hypothetical protein JOD82_004605 [Paenibacillus sp. 1182]|uniref:hypothetical protein n=1 Tax=Paenibacillus sp. 1182 TaxID=2806565 RepID=UPI001B6DAFB0|nr:hypothetical protein [Paenibacillus sp. 1182]MBP1311479.1 hypothetical protein [Paenibacillus sp. 1182]